MSKIELMLMSFADFKITPAPSVPEPWGLREGRAVGILVTLFSLDPFLLHLIGK